MRKKVLMFLVFALGLGLRLYGLNWDQGHHLHPDERFLTMVGTAIEWPKSIGQYFDTKESPLNPRNKGFGFFVYGPLPIFLTKAASQVIGMHDYAHFNLVGRVLAALADTGVIILLYAVSKKIWPSLLYSLMVLPIQLSHFFIVDPFLNFFLVLSFYAVLNWSPLLVGLFLGMALSSKITAILFLPIIFLVFLKRYKNIKDIILNTCYLILTTALAVRIFNPYSFIGLFRPNLEFIADIKELQSFNQPDSWYPPAVQWNTTKPLIFPAKNIFFWGIGVPMGIIILIAILLYGYTNLKKFLKKIKNGVTIWQYDNITIYLVWIFLLFTYQGVQFSKTMRYFLPIYPFMALVGGNFLSKLFSKIPRILRFLILGSLFLYPIMFISIYSHPQTRVQASEWIYENIPPGSTISCEHWDDCLPLSIDSKNHTLYKQEILELYGQENEEKWQKINQQLKKIDYIIISSSRLYGSIPTIPERYPETTKFYQQLFAGELGPPSGRGKFKKVAEITSYPSLFGLKLDDDSSEEAFTVYDHPKVLIFKKIEK